MSVCVELKCRLQNCLRYSQIACKSEHVLQYRWENLKLNLKMDAAFKNPFAICDPFPRQGLSNHTTFSLIESGAKVPLKRT